MGCAVSVAASGFHLAIAQADVMAPTIEKIIPIEVQTSVALKAAMKWMAPPVMDMDAPAVILHFSGNVVVCHDRRMAIVPAMIKNAAAMCKNMGSNVAFRSVLVNAGEIVAGTVQIMMWMRLAKNSNMIPATTSDFGCGSSFVKRKFIVSPLDLRIGSAF